MMPTIVELKEVLLLAALLGLVLLAALPFGGAHDARA